jgi:hypothetical protein
MADIPVERARPRCPIPRRKVSCQLRKIFSAMAAKLTTIGVHLRSSA